MLSLCVGALSSVQSRECRLVVRAYDKDLIFDDCLGLDVKDSQGRFMIRFTEDVFRDFMELDPDLYLMVYDSPGGRLLHKAHA